MRRPGLSALLGFALACSGPASEEARSGRGASASEPEAAEGETEELATDVDRPDPSAPDPVLARARTRMWGGRVPEELRRELLASADPDHRHAARLLQAIAGEAPSPIRSRSGARGLSQRLVDDAQPPDRPETHALEPEPRPNPQPKPKPVEGPPAIAMADDVAEIDDESLDPVPNLARLPPGSPVRVWFESGALEPGLTGLPGLPEPPPPPAFETRLFGAPLVLLSERPPLTSSLAGTADGPRLVILTSSSLRRHPEPEPEAIELELAGAGAVELVVQPLDSTHLRLSIPGAGAVPSFLDARPATPEVAIVDVARSPDGVVDLEIELAPGWHLRSVERLPNGASARFERVTIPP